MALRVVNMKKFALLIVVTVISFQWKLCSSLHVVIDPEAPTEVIDRLVDISCVLDKNDVTKIVLIEISKDDQPPMVMVRENFQPTFGSWIPKRFEAKGFITQGSDKSHLTLTIHSPRHEDGGEYTCSMFYLGLTGLLKEKRTTRVLVVKSSVQSRIARLEEDTKNMSIVIVNLINEKEVLSKEIVALKKADKNCSAEIARLDNADKITSSKIRRLEKDNNKISTKLVQFNRNDNATSADIVSLKNVDRVMSTKIVSLETDRKAASVQIQRLIDEAKTTSAFSAMLTKKPTLTDGMTLVFDNLFLNHGLSGYDVTTGIYTAPRDGLYFFDLFLTLSYGGIEVDITVNNRLTGSALYAYSNSTTGRWDQSAINTVLVLKAGDKVKAVVRGPLGPNPVLDDQAFSNFGGHLIRLL